MQLENFKQHMRHGIYSSLACKEQAKSAIYHKRLSRAVLIQMRNGNYC